MIAKTRVVRARAHDGPMKAPPPTRSPGAQLGEGEPPPLPPPPVDFEDDHYFEDDDEPSWWSTIRPLTAVHAAAPCELEAAAPRSTPRVAEPMERPERPERPRARTADDEITAAAHVLRVRARLAPDEQLAFDELMRGPAATDILTMLVNRGEDDAIDRLRRRLDDEPTAAEAARRALGRQIASLSALLSTGEQARAHAGLAFLWPEELAALQARLAGLSAPEAAALLRTYLAPRR
jgi:hypothetical protein